MSSEENYGECDKCGDVIHNKLPIMASCSCGGVYTPSTLIRYIDNKLAAQNKRIEKLEAEINLVKVNTGRSEELVAKLIDKNKKKLEKLEQDWKEHIGIWTHIGLDKRLERLEKATKGTLFNYEGVGRIGLLENKYKKLEQVLKSVNHYLIHLYDNLAHNFPTYTNAINALENNQKKLSSGAKEDKYQCGCGCADCNYLTYNIICYNCTDYDKYEKKESPKQDLSWRTDIYKCRKKVEKLKKEFVEDLCFLESQYPISTNEDAIRLAGEIKDLNAKYSKAELAKEEQ